MNKFLLFVFLLSVVACTTIEEYSSDDLEVILQGIDVKTAWNKVKKFAKQARDFLKSIGLWDPLINILKTSGRGYAINYCVSKNIAEAICSSIVDFVLNFIH